MYPNSEYICFSMHRAFLGHKPNGYKLVVDHIDNNPLNDKLYNLQVNITKKKRIKNNEKELQNILELVGISQEKKMDSLI